MSTRPSAPVRLAVPPILLIVLLSVLATASSCPPRTEPEPTEYDAYCPTDPVELRRQKDISIEYPFGLELTEFDFQEFKAEVAFGPPSMPYMETCTYPLTGMGVIRGRGSYGLGFVAYVVFGDDWSSPAGTHWSEEVYPHYYGDRWAWALMLPTPRSGRITGPYSLLIPSAIVSDEPAHDVSLQFLYDCGLPPIDGANCVWDEWMDQTYQHALLDLSFRPGEFDDLVVTDPEVPQQHQPFRIRWATEYLREACIDPPGESGVFTVNWYLFKEGVGGVFDQGSPEVGSVPMGNWVVHELEHPGIPEVGVYYLHLELNPLEGDERDVCEGRSDFDATINNLASHQFVVDPCECPHGIGNLLVQDFDTQVPEVEGEPLLIEWEECYSRWCPTTDGESGPYVTHIEIFEYGKPDAIVLSTHLPRETIRLGDCRRHSLSFAETLAEGGYTVRVTVDVEGVVPECPTAPVHDNDTGHSIWPRYDD